MRGRAGNPHYLLMIFAAAVSSLTVAASPARCQRQRRRGGRSPAAVSAALAAGLLAGYGVALPVGAVGAYLVALTARTSLRTGAFAALGVATADGVYAVIAVCGGAALAPALRPVTEPLHWGSVAVLIALAAYGTVTSIRRYRGRRDDGVAASASSALRAYLGLWGMTMMNPLTIVYFTALVLGRQGAATPGRAEQAVFVVAVFAASASWQLVSPGAARFSAAC